jgi:hypothetical protein
MRWLPIGPQQYWFRKSLFLFKFLYVGTVHENSQSKCKKLEEKGNKCRARRRLIGKSSLKIGRGTLASRLISI